MFLFESENMLKHNHINWVCVCVCVRVCVCGLDVNTKFMDSVGFQPDGAAPSNSRIKSLNRNLFLQD